MNWYHILRQCTALRKHVLRTDLHVHCGEQEDFSNTNDLDASIKAVLTSAIIKGLDVVGIIGHTAPYIGQRAQQIIQDNQLDVYAIPGQEYVTTDNWRLLVYNLKQPLQAGMDLKSTVELTHKQQGFVMAIHVTKRQAQHLNSMITDSGEKSPECPDAVEVYNAVTGGYQDLHISSDYAKFMSSAAKNARDMENANVFTLIGRKDIEALGLLPENSGVNYTPKYLQREDELQKGADPSAVAEGLTDQPTSI